MRAPGLLPSLLPRTAAVCLGGLLLGAILSTGCTPGSSESSTSPDAAPAPNSPPSSPGASSPNAPTSSENGADRTVTERLEDASVAARVKRALVRTRSLRPFDFTPTVTQGHLTLRGDVDTREQYQRVERVASNVEGVTAVTNQVTVQGRPASDADSSADAQTTYHTVRRGETLIGIARAYDVSVQQLRTLNNLTETLQPGQEIRVR